MTAVPGLSPTKPVMVLLPVSVIVDPARTAKFAAVPSATGLLAATFTGATTGSAAAGADFVGSALEAFVGSADEAFVGSALEAFVGSADGVG